MFAKKPTIIGQPQQFVRPAMAPDTMVAAVAQNTN